MILPAACAGKFRVERELRSGGFGSVLLATQIDLERPVAIKLLRPEICADAEQRGRFASEARVTASLDHPHIVRVLDHGVDEGVPWIAYEYLPGRTLTDTMAGRPLDWRTAALAGAQLAAALEAAHAAGVLHRDVKPDNVLESSPGHWKITDFGIAKWTSGSEVKTKTGMVLGTPAYMAPELLIGSPASPATDLHALGVLLFELLTARMPFPGDTPLQTMQARLSGDAPPLAPLCPDAPPALTVLVDALLSGDPARRPPDAAHVRKALEHALQIPAAPARPRPSRRIPADSRSVSDVTRPVDSFPTSSNSHAPPLTRHSATRHLPLATVLCLCLLLALTFALTRHRPPVPTPSPLPTGAPDFTHLTALESEVDAAAADPLPGPSLLTIITRLAEYTGPRLAVVAKQIDAYGAWYRKQSALFSRLTERLEHLENRPGYPAETLRVLDARIQIHRCAADQDVDQAKKLANLAKRLLEGTLQLNLLGGEAEIADAIPYETAREPALRRALVSVRTAVEDLVDRPERASRHHGHLIENLRWFASQFVYYRFQSRDLAFPTREAQLWFLAPLAARPGPRAALVHTVLSDAWHAGAGWLKVNPTVLRPILARVDRLAAETPALGDSLGNFRAALARTGLVVRDEADPIGRIVRPRLRHGGLAIAVMKGGEVKEAKCYGLADIERQLPVSRRTVFDLASIGKQFTGLALLLLVDRGSTNLEADVRTIVPEVPAYDAKRPITLAHLAHHTSGLPKIPEGTGPKTLPGILDWLKATKRPSSPPGDTFEYNNLNYVLLAVAVERIAKEPFNTLVRREIFTKAGMASAQLLDAPGGTIAGRAVGYCLGAKPCRQDDAIPGSANVFASLDDMIAWERSLVANAWMKRSDLRRPFLQGIYTDGSEVDYGFGWSRTEEKGKQVLWHDGDWLGASAYVARHLSSGLTVIVLSNAARVDVELIQREVAELYTP